MKNLQECTLLVTGGAGFIGSEFVRSFSTKFKHTIVFDNLTYAADVGRIRKQLGQDNVDLIVDDLNNVNLYKNKLESVDYIVHFAAESHVDNSIRSSQVFIETNTVGTFKLLELFREVNPAARFLYVSTDEVYGSSEEPKVESDNLNPSSQYSATKAAGELLCFANYKTHSQNIVVTRGCNNFGPYQHGEKLIPNVLTKLLHGRKVQIYGNGENTREWIHISDHCTGIFAALLKGKAGEVYNIGTGERYSNNELVSKILNLLQLPQSFIEYVSDRKGHDFSYSLNSSKIADNLYWVPKVSFEEGLKLTVNWYKENSTYAESILR